ncbi:MAG: hypothetical protein SGI77_20025 [Pirellulaceae bacterium]|nr:hypothetical protein [Pirellulaceae bacterium]
MKTILTAVIVTGVFAVAGCSQTVQQPASTNTNGAGTSATTGHDGHMGTRNMTGGQEHGTGHMGGRGE